MDQVSIVRGNMYPHRAMVTIITTQRDAFNRNALTDEDCHSARRVGIATRKDPWLATGGREHMISINTSEHVRWEQVSLSEAYYVSVLQSKELSKAALLD